jgi:hypothetical protein
MLERTFTTNMCIGMQMGTCHLPIFVKNVILFAKPWFLIFANSCPHDLAFRLCTFHIDLFIDLLLTF